MADQEAERVWTVVEVSRGFAVQAYVFAEHVDARRCYASLRRRRNLDEDDVQLFHNSIIKQRPTSQQPADL